MIAIDTTLESTEINSEVITLLSPFYLLQYNTIQIKFLRRRNFGAVRKESLTFGHRVGGAVIVARG